ncbi:hypothetical protein ACHAW6_000832 [Cyclotella cf. meneghiniana]
MSSLTKNFVLSNPQMVMCMFASKRTHMAFHKQESMPRNFLKNALMQRAAIKALSHLVSGDMTGNSSPLPYVLGILASNKLVQNIPNISCT